ncbi:MAG: hypothetical protein JSV77_06675 [Dehalococcoidales bacterium]|nr:MAG: hypothetical protein JSV77_06675 [Dehalococcoidales bacterium]
MSAARGSWDGGVSSDWSGWMEGLIEHCKGMRCFLRYHITWQVARTSPIDEMLLYDVRHGLPETGGTVNAFDEIDWLLLLPLRAVTRRQIVSN